MIATIKLNANPNKRYPVIASTITLTVTVDVDETCLIKLRTRKIKKKKLRARKIIFIISNLLKKATHSANVKKTEILIKEFLSFLRDKKAKKKMPVIATEKSKLR